MTKPFTIQIDDEAAEQLRRIANDLGETPEQFAARIVANGVDAYEASLLFARRAKGVDRQAALAWLNDVAARSGSIEPDADDRLPDGFTR